MPTDHSRSYRRWNSQYAVLAPHGTETAHLVPLAGLATAALCGAMIASAWTAHDQPLCARCEAEARRIGPTSE